MSQERITRTNLILICALVGVLTMAATFFAVNYFSLKKERDQALYKEELRKHDEELMKGQRDYTVNEMLEREQNQTRAQRARQQDVPEAALEVEDRHAREDATGQEHSYAPGPAGE